MILRSAHAIKCWRVNGTITNEGMIYKAREAHDGCLEFEGWTAQDSETE